MFANHTGGLFPTLPPQIKMTKTSLIGDLTVCPAETREPLNSDPGAIYGTKELRLLVKVNDILRKPNKTKF